MWKLTAVNDFVIKFANVNGSGSASANGMFAKAIFRMGIPVSPKNIFPSNIQGLPTWYEVRVNGKGYLGRRGGVDIAVAMNAQTLAKDVAEIEPGGYLIYDSTKPLPTESLRSDIHILPIPITELCRSEFTNAKQRQMFKNIVYVGALSALLDIEFEVLEQLVGEQFPGKEHLIGSNMKALAIGRDYMLAQFECPLSIKLQRSTVVGDKILVDGNTAAGLGCVYAGATVVGWYPITPSTSVVDAFTKYANQLRVDSATGRKKFAIAQAEDELAAIGMVIGAMWNGARAFTATSGPGISLMSEFLGLAYFAEIPTVLFNVQRAGPSTGMPTRTQQADVFACAYASHGDTKQLLLFPANPTECFEMGAAAFDIAERMQTPVIIMSDLDLGMNDHVTPAFQWDDAVQWDRGKVLNAAELDEVERFGRYRDIDGDGIPYRTLPGTHPEKGQFFTRGTSRDPDAIYTEESHHYVDNMDRLVEKFNTATQYIPAPEVELSLAGSSIGVVFYGTTADAMYEARDLLAEQGQHVDLMRIKSFPFHRQVADFCEQRDLIFVVEQNRDGQMRKMLINECELHPKTLLSVLNYDGMPITATTIQSEISDQLDARQGKLQVVGAK